MNNIRLGSEIEQNTWIFCGPYKLNGGGETLGGNAVNWQLDRMTDKPKMLALAVLG